MCRFILFCDCSAPQDVGAAEVRSFLEYVAVRRHVSASTQNQGLNAPVFPSKQVLGRELGELDASARAKRPGSLPMVLSRAGVDALVSAMEDQKPW